MTRIIRLLVALTAQPAPVVVSETDTRYRLIEGRWTELPRI